MVIRIEPCVWPHLRAIVELCGLKITLIIFSNLFCSITSVISYLFYYVQLYSFITSVLFYYICSILLLLFYSITSVLFYYICSILLHLFYSITSVLFHYICFIPLHLFYYIKSVTLHGLLLKDMSTVVNILKRFWTEI